MNLKEKVSIYREANKLSQEKFATLAGINSGALSAWLNDKYSGNPDTVEIPIAQFLMREEERQKITSKNTIPFADTIISQEIEKVLEYCRTQKGIGCIHGDAGVGKTMTATRWSKDKPDVLYLRARMSSRRPLPFFKQLAKAIKSRSTGTLSDIYEDMADKLYRQDRTIIIDEAQHLTFETLENIRDLADETEIAVIFIGNAKIYTNMIGNKQEDYAQQYSRLLLHLPVLTDRFALSDIENIFGHNLDKEAKEYLLNMARTKNGLRSAVNVYINASNTGDTSKKGLKTSATMTGKIAQSF